MEHEFIGHVLLKLTDIHEEVSQEERDTLGPNPVEARLGNLIRRETNTPERRSYTKSGTMNMRRDDDTAMIIEFGYYDGSNAPNPDIPKTQFLDPPPKYPKKEGITVLTVGTYLPLEKINYIIKLKYDVQEEAYNFI